MRISFTIYRVVYCATLAIILAILFEGLPFLYARSVPKALLLWAYVFVVIAAGVITVLAERTSKHLTWAVVVAFCALFTWHGWCGPNGFFIQTEFHSVDGLAAAAEKARFTERAIILYVIMLAWFISLPVICQFAEGRRR